MSATANTQADPRELRQRAADLRDQAQNVHDDTVNKPESERAEGLAEVGRLVQEAQGLLRQASEAEAAEQRANDADARRRALAELSDQIGARGHGGTAPAPGPGADPRNTRDGLHQYSLLRAVRGWIGIDGAKFDGLELEEHQHLREQARASGGRAPWGFFAPFDSLRLDVAAVGANRHRVGAEVRAALDTTTGAGASITTTDPSLIEYLRAQLVIRRLGARLMTGLAGSLQVPKKTATGQHYWITEGSEPTVSNITLGQVDLSPKTIGGFQQYTRKFLMQTGRDAEMMLRADLTEVIAEGLDKAAINGSGSGAEPEGILTNSSVPTVALGANGAAPTHDAIVDMETTVGGNNALRNQPAYLTTWPGKKTLKTTPVVSGQTDMLWERLTDTVNGYPAEASTLVPSNLTKGSGTNLSAMIFGDFTQVMLALWSGVDILVNPYSPLGRSGGVEIVALQDADIALRHDVAFSKIVDMITS